MKNTKYKHILLAIDFSKGSSVVNDRAKELAIQMGAKLTLLHIVEPLPGYGYAFVGATEVEMELMEAARKQLAKLGKKLSVAVKDQHVELGPTKVEINRVAEDLKVDLIIVGSHGRHGFDAL